MLCIIAVLSLIWVLRYAKKVKADPSKSLVKDIDTSSLIIDIPSGSGQATAVMPIMIPLADMLDITRQTAVLAFQLGDGISNTFWPTNGTLLIYLGLSKVPLKSWYKFILPLQFIFLLAELVMLFVACQIGYGPMLQISAIAKQTRFPFIPPRFSILFSGD